MHIPVVLNHSICKLELYFENNFGAKISLPWSLTDANINLIFLLNIIREKLQFDFKHELYLILIRTVLESI